MARERLGVGMAGLGRLALGGLGVGRVTGRGSLGARPGPVYERYFGVGGTSKKLGHVPMLHKGVRGFAIFDKPEGVVRLEASESSRTTRSTVTATTVNSQELYPGELAQAHTIAMAAFKQRVTDCSSLRRFSPVLAFGGGVGADNPGPVQPRSYWISRYLSRLGSSSSYRTLPLVFMLFCFLFCLVQFSMLPPLGATFVCAVLQTSRRKKRIALGPLRASGLRLAADCRADEPTLIPSILRYRC